MDGKLAIMLLSAHRLDYAKRTLQSTLDNIERSPELHVHIGVDGDSADYMNELMDLACQHPKVDNLNVTWSNSGSRGYAANYNAACATIWGLPSVKWVLPLEDDWVLQRPINLTWPIEALEDETLDIGCIRMGYLGWTSELRGSMRYHQASAQHYLRLDPDSPELHVFSGHPRVETVSWERGVGEWPLGHNPGYTEINVCQIRAARIGVAWPMDLVKPLGDAWVHIGALKSYDDGSGRAWAEPVPNAAELPVPA